MFWTVLLLIICFSVPALFFILLLGSIMGNLVYVIAGVLLLAGVISVVAGAYQKITERLDRVEKKLDKLLEMRNDHEK